MPHIQGKRVEAECGGEQLAWWVWGSYQAHVDSPFVVRAVVGEVYEGAVGEGHQEALRTVDRVHAGEGMVCWKRKRQVSP